MKIAVIGTGISGNVLAYHLDKEHDITVYESNSYIGGHTHTHEIHMDNNQYNIDTGFIVFNYKTYPNFIKLLEKLNVETQKSLMSFSVKCETTGLEYNGNNINTLFSQRRNLLRPSFYKMIADILRFNREAPEFLKENCGLTTLRQYLKWNQYSDMFIEHYIIPMGSAIWSSSHKQMMDFPALFFIRFFVNHGLLKVNDRPQWYVIKGGSKQYVEKLTENFKHRIRLNTGVKQVKRFSSHVEVTSDNHETEKYDYVFFACHSDQSLQMINNPDNLEQSILSAFAYQDNEAVLHTDTSLLPSRKLAWASWNYHKTKNHEKPAALTYNMNILQNLKSKETFCVTLNNTQAINPEKMIKTLNYSHPLFTKETLKAQSRHSELNGNKRCFYAGAYWGYGFHEDGVVSALNAVNDFKEMLAYEKPAIYRAG
jgi:predicted NAD/FAD-binding protein